MIILFILSLAAWFAIFVFVDTHLVKQSQAVSEGQKNNTSLSIVIAARNEELNIIRCLSSIRSQTCLPVNTQVIVVDDHSGDQTADAVRNFQAASTDMDIQLVTLSGNTGKKAALRAGLPGAMGDFVFLTDADCFLAPNTLATALEKAISTGKPVVMGPVLYESNSFYQRILELENLNNQCVSEAFLNAGKPVMANAANLLLHRSILPLYQASLNNTSASGDDVFFVQGLGKEQYTGCYSLRNAVFTDPPADLDALVQQRLRWASKSVQYKSQTARLAAALVWLINLFFVAGLLLPFFDARFVFPVILALLVKAMIEFAYHRHWFHKYNVHHNWLQGLVLSCSYPVYVTTIGLLATLRVGFRWKGRYYKA